MDIRDMVHKLVNNEIYFLSNISSYDREKLIELVRQVPLKDRVMNSCMESLKRDFPYYAFRIAFDVDKYEDFCRDYLDKNFDVLKDTRFFGHYFIGNCKWAVDYLKKNVRRFNELDSDILFIILRYSMDVMDKELLNLLLFCDDLEIRGRVMVELMEMAPYRFFEFYYDLLAAFVIKDENGNVINIMDEKYVSRIAYSIVDYDLGLDNYEQVKDFILRNYSSNTLAERLDGVNVDSELGVEFREHLDVLSKDIDVLFMTSKSYKYRLFMKYQRGMSDRIVKEFYNAIKDFIQIDEQVIEHMFKVGLGDKFIEYVKKYMELSTGAKVVGNAGMGSATRSFIVGDYVVKCSYKKWCPARCPDLYLIAKNYEEEIIKSHFGSVIGALEVQKCYHKPLNPKNERLFGKFNSALEELGYSFDDNVLGFNESPNIFYLDDYREADCEDPESLPEWFKKDPIVLVDRDYVTKIKK